MTKEELRQSVLDAISEIAPEADFDALEPNAGLREQIDLDSMDFLNVMIALHETLGIDIPEADYPELFTLNGAMAYLERRLEADGG